MFELYSICYTYSLAGQSQETLIYIQYFSQWGGRGQSYEMLWAKRCNTNFQFGQIHICAKQGLKGQLHGTGFVNRFLTTYLYQTSPPCLFKTFYCNVYRFSPTVFTLC
jgi:hypothetical protein